MAGHAGRHIGLAVAVERQLAAARQLRRANLQRLRRRIRGVQAGEMLRHRLQIVVRQVAHHVDHHRIGAPALAEIDQLVVEIAGWLAGDARIVAVAGGASLVAVAASAGSCTLGHRVRNGLRLWPGSGRCQCQGQGENGFAIRSHAVMIAERPRMTQRMARCLAPYHPPPKAVIKGASYDGIVEKYACKLCKLHDSAATIGYAQPRISRVIKLLRRFPLCGIALATSAQEVLSLQNRETGEVNGNELPGRPVIRHRNGR